MAPEIYSAAVAAAVALVTSFVAFRAQERRLQRDFELDRDKLRTGFMAEQVARQLLETREAKRTFTAIKARLGGFSDENLRQILVRAGAIRFERKKDEAEMWGLLHRNPDEL